MLIYFLVFLFGVFVGISLMCLLQINKEGE